LKFIGVNNILVKMGIKVKKQINIQSHKANDQLIIVLNGELDAYTSSQFDEDMQGLITNATTVTRMDCSALNYISSAGLSSLILLVQVLKKQNCTLELINVNAMVLNIIEVTGLCNKVIKVAS
jgi:anti-anti-sigma factor